jgi:hypothetical protein
MVDYRFDAIFLALPILAAKHLPRAVFAASRRNSWSGFFAVSATSRGGFHDLNPLVRVELKYWLSLRSTVQDRYG